MANVKEIWTTLGVGLVLAGLILNQGWSLRADINAVQSSLQAQIAELRDGQADLQRRVARIEGLLQGMLPSVAFVKPASLEEVRANGLSCNCSRPPSATFVLAVSKEQGWRRTSTP